MAKFRDPLPVGNLETEEEKRNVERNFRDIINDGVKHQNRHGTQFPQERVVHSDVVLRGDGTALVELEGESVFSGRDSYSVKLTIELEMGQELPEPRAIGFRKIDGRTIEIVSTADMAGRRIAVTAFGN